MKIINVQQGTQEWHKARAERFTASEAPAMMGDSKYQSRSQLLKQKATGLTEEVTAAQQHLFDKGHAAEASARTIAESIIDEELYPVTGLLEDSNLLASFDGLTMMENIVWEHKLYSKDLATQIKTGDLSKHYIWQLEQQLLVSGADKALFMCSDGTEANMEYGFYVSNAELREQLIAGWAQFEKDLSAYEHKAAKPVPVAATQEDLPAVVIDLVGEVRESNLMAVKDVILARVKGVKTDLQTDQDFADADATVKFFTKGEKQLEEVKQRALAQTASIADLFSTVDNLKEEMRSKRLELSKRVKERKEAIRTEIVMAAKQALAEHIAELEKDIAPYQAPAISSDFAGAIKGKKTVDSLQSAADDELARAKVEANRAVALVSENAATLQELAGEFMFLFSDSHSLVSYSNDHLKAEIKSRIATHKEAEAKREAEQRERIRQEEEAKAKAEAQAKAAEETAPQQAEQSNTGNTPAPESIEREAVASAIPPVATDKVSIPRTEYNRLLQDSALLAALQAAGVDNWDGYQEAIESLEAA